MNHASIDQRQKGAAMAACKQKEPPAAVGDAKNRKALEDIGNMVNLRITEGKQVNLPIITSLSTQLIAKAAAKKQVTQLCDGVAKKKGTVKETDLVIISPVTTEQKEKKETINSNASSSSKKKAYYSLTSVLTARSKIACGIQDIDAADDVDNEFAMIEYVEDLYKFYKLHEKLCRPRDYMTSQIEINEKMRSILVDWLIEVHQKFELMPETLYLTVSIIDRYLSIESVPRKELQLVGISSMLIACKYEEIWAPQVKDFIYISEGAYTKDHVLKLEKRILNKLDWSLTFPTPYVFIVRFLKAAVSNKETEHMAFFFAELGLMSYSMVMHRPSMVAAYAVYAAHCTLSKNPLWNKTLQYYTGFSAKDLRGGAKFMVEVHTLARDSKFNAIYRKYSKDEYGRVALRDPATEIVKNLTEEK